MTFDEIKKLTIGRDLIVNFSEEGEERVRYEGTCLDRLGQSWRAHTLQASNWACRLYAERRERDKLPLDDEVICVHSRDKNQSNLVHISEVVNVIPNVAKDPISRMTSEEFFREHHKNARRVFHAGIRNHYKNFDNDIHEENKYSSDYEWLEPVKQFIDKIDKRAVIWGILALTALLTFYRIIIKS